MPKNAVDEDGLAEEITRILGKPLPRKKADPVLLNSAAERILDEQKLEEKARKALSAEKKKAVASKRLGLAKSNPEKEKALKKTATKGVVRLFNALRQAQSGSGAPRRETKDAVAKDTKPVPVDKFFDIASSRQPDERGNQEDDVGPDDVSLSDDE